MKARASNLVLPAILVVLAGCTDTCDAGEGVLVRFSGGTTSQDGDFYESSSIQGPYLHFPSGRIYEFEHRLRASPDTVLTWLSFDERAISVRDNNVAESAGNQAVIECVDGSVVRVRNDTCAETWVRVVAMVNGDGSATVPACSER